MNALELLNFLLSTQQSGTDLSTLDIVVTSSRYTEGGYEDTETYPSSVQVRDTELVLGGC